jgi:hypothetical protein
MSVYVGITRVLLLLRLQLLLQKWTGLATPVLLKLLLSCLAASSSRF